MEERLFTLGRKGLKIAQAYGLAQAGVAFAVCLAYAAISPLPEPLWWSALAFGLNIPVGLTHSLMSRDFHTYPRTNQHWRRIQGGMGYLSNLLTFYGALKLLQHISLLHAWGFGLTVLGGALLWLGQSRHLRRMKEQTPPHLQPPPETPE